MFLNFRLNRLMAIGQVLILVLFHNGQVENSPTVENSNGDPAGEKLAKWTEQEIPAGKQA